MSNPTSGEKNKSARRSTIWSNLSPEQMTMLRLTTGDDVVPDPVGDGLSGCDLEKTYKTLLQGARRTMARQMESMNQILASADAAAC